MNTRSSKEYRYIFTTPWKQASTSHLSSPLTDNASGKLLIIFILPYLFVLPTSFLRIHKTHNCTSLQVWHTNVLHFCSFCKQTFSGATREWDTLYFTFVYPLFYIFSRQKQRLLYTIRLHDLNLTSKTVAHKSLLNIPYTKLSVWLLQ
jgi:hypothetical protein